MKFPVRIACMILVSFNIKVFRGFLCPFLCSLYDRRRKKKDESTSFFKEALRLHLNCQQQPFHASWTVAACSCIGILHLVFSLGDVLPLTHRNVCWTIISTRLSIGYIAWRLLTSQVNNHRIFQKDGACFVNVSVVTKILFGLKQRNLVDTRIIYCETVILQTNKQTNSDLLSVLKIFRRICYLLQTFLQTTNGMNTIYHFYNSELLKASIKQSEAHKCCQQLLL